MATTQSPSLDTALGGAGSLLSVRHPTPPVYLYVADAAFSFYVCRKIEMVNGADCRPLVVRTYRVTGYWTRSAVSATSCRETWLDLCATTHTTELLEE